MTETQAAAVLTALNTQLPGSLVAYDIDDLPAVRPADYIEVTVSRRFGGEQRNSGHKTTSGYRVTTRAVGETVTNARTLHGHARTALEFKMLTVSGEHTSPIQFESEEPVGPDDGAFSGLLSWTYTIKE